MRFRMTRDFISRLSAGTFLTAALLGGGGLRAERPPNVLLIVTDDQGFADFGFQGSERIETPHIDALARAGIRFTNGYVSHPYCSPTRAGLLTGRYQQRFGHETNPAYLPDDHEVGLPVGEVTLADVLKEAGYVTGAIGKWHLGAGAPFRPLRRGFDEFFGFLGGGHDYFESAEPGAPAEEYTTALVDDGRRVELRGYLTDELARRAARFVRRHRKRPFFLFLAFNAPHTPYQAPERYRKRFKNLPDGPCRTYAAMISAVDDGVGRVVETLRKLGIYENTLIFFLSDNGGQTRFECADNGPLRGRKGLLYEGGVRVPFFLVWPGRLEPGTFEPLASSLDVFATSAAAAGARPSAERPLDGVDLLPFLTGREEGPPREALYWRVGGGVRWAVRRGSWKLVVGKEGTELYHVEADIGETRDLAGERPDMVRELTALYREWNVGMVPPRWRDPQ